jgi:broad specificity phosphatase PhoE
VTTILLVRHGETDWNRDRRVQGHSDTPLNETGRAQARALAEELAQTGLDAVYSSDLLRAYETARIVAESKGLDVTAIRELRERHFGTWEGMTDDEIFSRFPEARHGPWGDAETKDEMAERVLDGLGRIAALHDGGRVLVVTHGGPVRAALAACGAASAGPIGNCSLRELRFRDGAFVAVTAL